MELWLVLMVPLATVYAFEKSVNQMKPEIRLILETIIADNGEIVYDNEFMTCKSCGAEALGARGLNHKPDCIVERAKREIT